jgi:ABC-type molybdenum transport system ATPase subunit/photorepair protein PhrA
VILTANRVSVGLDPFVSRHISRVLHRLAEASAPRIVLSLRPQDVIPDWITHIVYAGEDGKVESLGPKEEVMQYLNHEQSIPTKLEAGKSHSERIKLSRDAYEKFDTSPPKIGEPLVQMEGVRIKYGSNMVLGDWAQEVDGSTQDGFWWSLHRGQRYLIAGANGSGKTTLISLVTSDHPQTYSAPVRIFERSRLPSPGVPGITIFEVQARMGHSSPEVHALFPKHLSVRRTVETAWSDTPITNPKLTGDAIRRVEACLHWFEAELNPALKDGQITSGKLDWASHFTFGELSYSAQRVLLFLRATIRNVDIVILDEAFSGMDDLVRDKCLLFLSRGESMTLHYTDSGPRPVESEIAKKGEVVVSGLQDQQALLCVSHSQHEIPGCIREWVCLPEPGMGAPRFGRFDGPVELSNSRWEEIWDDSDKR